MLTENNARDAMGQTLYGTDGDKIGKIAQVYLSDTTGEPEFLTVNTGLFGTNESFVPAADATMSEDGVTVPFSKDKIKDAPSVAADGHLEVDEEQQLFDYYGLSSTQPATTQTSDTMTADRADTTGTTDVGNATYDSTYGDTRNDVDGTDTRHEVTDTEGHDTSGPNTDDAMTRSEEELQVGTRTQQAGKARLRKYVTTEQQSVTVPVSKEYAVLETEPITDANVDSALGGGDITEEEHEVLLNEEVVEVSKTVKPVERVRLGTETRTEDQTVTDEVRKENIEVDGDVDQRA